MSNRLLISYDPPSDTLFVDWGEPNAEQDSRSIEPGVLARINPKTQAIETIEILNFLARFGSEKSLDLPIEGSLRLMGSK
jgi:hypothetical protein